MASGFSHLRETASHDRTGVRIQKLPRRKSGFHHQEAISAVIPRRCGRFPEEILYRTGSDQFSSVSFTLCMNWCAMAPSTTRWS
jgi:hypothetical protein